MSRQLVYFHYGNRAGLLHAMARHRDENSGFACQVASADDLPPVEALEALLRAWCAYLPEMLPGARALEAALTAGDEGGEVWRDRMQELWQIFRHATSTYTHLVDERGWAPADYAERTIRSVMDELLTS